MKRYNEDFLDKIKGFNLQVLENSKYPIYALSKELKFIYFNPAWSHFAKDNQFEGRALKKSFPWQSLFKIDQKVFGLNSTFKRIIKR